MFGLEIKNSIVCPKCKGNSFELKREATYIYTYKLEAPVAENTNEKDEALPFLFDNREKSGDREYLQCGSCGSQFPCESDIANAKIHMTIVQKAIRSDNVENPDFLG